MQTKPKPTIKDIARLTGLSKGTVDRVLHNRAGVAKKSYEKVMKVIQDMGYEPNLYASILASHKERIIAVMLPDSTGNDFWELYNSGLKRAQDSVGHFGITIKRVGYNQYDVESFKTACGQVMELAPSGVVIAPMYRFETLAFTERLKKEGIPYVYVDTKLEEDGYMAFYGMPAYQSGYLCASLLTDERKMDKVILVRVQRDKARQSDPTIDRREGFMAYMKENYPECSIRSLFINPSEPETIEETLENDFKENPDERNVVMFNSRIYLISDFLRKHKSVHFRVIGFDNLKENMNCLKKGLVSSLITQHPDEQVFHATQALADKIVFGKNPVKRDNFVHMDILTRYNVDYY